MADDEEMTLVELIFAASEAGPLPKAENNPRYREAARQAHRRMMRDDPTYRWNVECIRNMQAKLRGDATAMPSEAAMRPRRLH